LKKYIFFFLLIISVNSISLQCRPEQKTVEAKTSLVLVNPGAWYLRSFAYLVENKIIDIPDLQLLAVYHAEALDKYNDCQEFIKTQKTPLFKARSIDKTLHVDSLFQKNACTADYYEIFKNSSGILFLGGADIPPVVYGQKTNLLTGISTPHRHFFELSLLHHLIGGREDSTLTPFLEENPDYVVFGFCLGMQTMNAAAGGTMHQDIPSDIYGLHYVEDILQMDRNLLHKNYWPNIRKESSLHWRNFHKIRLLNDSFFDKKLEIDTDMTPLVCSIHHQAVKDIAGSYKAAASSLDAEVIEALYHIKYRNVFGVQFHPEFYTLYDPNGMQYKLSPNDSAAVSEYEMLKQSKSLQFHEKYWAYFSGLF